MSDITITTKSAAGTRWILEGLEQLMEWARMQFKQKDSRNPGLRQGKVDDKARFPVQGEPLPIVTEQTMKYLGKWFEDTIKDTGNNQKQRNNSVNGSKVFERSGLPRKVQDLVLPVWAVTLILVASASL